MSDPYERVKGGRLAFKGGSLATRTKTIDKKRKKKKKDKDRNDKDETLDLDKEEQGVGEGSESAAGGEQYTIDGAKRMKYEQLFPVEAKKFGYEPKTNFKSVEDALDDRVKKKADRYCK
ncbi:hypothetical protein SESBI_34378 [Sesbania bispinosa]|nr:hypothetical protein SESBI_34378 [Sesbania bispinosa]